MRRSNTQHKLHVEYEQTEKMVYTLNERGDHWDDLNDFPDHPQRPLLEIDGMQDDLADVINNVLLQLAEDLDGMDFFNLDINLEDDGDEDEDVEGGNEVEIVCDQEERVREEDDDKEEEEERSRSRFRYDGDFVFNNKNNNTENMEVNQPVADVADDPLPGGSRRRSREDDDEDEEDRQRFKWDWYDFPESDVESDAGSDYTDHE